MNSFPILLCKSVLHDPKYGQEYAGFKFDYAILNCAEVKEVECKQIDIPLTPKGLDIIEQIVSKDDPLFIEMVNEFAIQYVAVFNRGIHERLLKMRSESDY